MPVVIENLNQFRRDLRRSADATPREVTKVLQSVGRPLAKKAGGFAPTGTRPDDAHPGQLAKGYKVRVRGSTGSIVNPTPYSGGAEWGQRGKWKGFQRYGGKGRFAWRAVEESAEWIVAAVYAGLQGIVSAHGWFRGRKV